MLHVASDDSNFVMHIAFGHYLHREWCYTVQVLNTSEDDMSTQLDPAQLAIEFLRRDKTESFTSSVPEKTETVRAGVRGFIDAFFD